MDPAEEKKKARENVMANVATFVLLVALIRSAFARIELRENFAKNLNQVTRPDRDSNPGHLVSRPDALTVTAQIIRNEAVLERVGEEGMLLKLIRKRKTDGGVTNRRKCLLKDALEGMVNGRRIRGRRIYQMIDDVKIYGSYEETKRKAENRKDWKKLGLQ
ncbi:hypothetical protein ANN_11005 [Periplaneta americana]|uniref:Uncharacterized protein n=1 Tax=Periplaneta americana TaxID=6978 RepID=A0ABQ8T532_PERAM|nr:hypothetical protein ANN_11005 [Periplaneta americana]